MTETALSLSEQFEKAANLAAKLYAQGKDTTEIDAEVDRLSAELDAAAKPVKWTFPL